MCGVAIIHTFVISAGVVVGVEDDYDICCIIAVMVEDCVASCVGVGVSCVAVAVVTYAVVEVVGCVGV